MLHAAEGWVSIHRQLWENEYLWDDKPFARGQAWIDLVMLVNHHDNYVISHERMVLRGQRILSIRKLADRWGWSRHKVSDFLNSLQSAGMAKIERATQYVLVTIVNYDLYQSDEGKKCHKRATHGPLEATNNNDNNIILRPDTPDGDIEDEQPEKKKRKVKTFESDSRPYKAAAYMAQMITERIPDYPYTRESVLEKTIQNWAKDIDLLLRYDDSDYNRFRQVIKFAMTDDFWRKNVLSGATLRKQYGKLLSQMED